MISNIIIFNRLCIWILICIFLPSHRFINGEPITDAGSSFEFSKEMKDYFSEELAIPASTEINPPFFKPTSKEKVFIGAAPIDNGWRLTFLFPKPVTFMEKNEAGAIYFEFNQTIDSSDFLSAQEKLGFLIKRLSNGYNSLSINPKQPLRVEAAAQGNFFILDLLPAYEVPYEGSRLLKIAKARLLIEERHYSAAFKYIDQLEQEYPDDKDLLLLNASLEGLLPRWQEEMKIFNELAVEYPEDEDVVTLSNEAFSPHSSYIQAIRQIQRTVGLAAVQLYGLQEELILAANSERVVYGGSQWQLFRGHISSIVNNQGQFVGFLGTRNQTTLYRRDEWASGSYVKGLIYGQETTLGVGLEIGRLLPKIQGQINVIACVHRPYWSVFETLAFYGREDLLKVQINSVYNRYFNWHFDLGAHRVGIKGTSNGFSSILASGEIFFNLTVGNPIIALNYGLDAEYITQQKTKIGIDGNKYNPVPYVTFENHSLRVFLYYTWRERWNLTIYGGETFNRLGLNAKTYGISLKYAKPLPCGWELELSAYRFPSTIVQGATGEYYTGILTFRF